MSDPAAPPTQESTEDVMRSLTKYLPGFMQVQNEQVLPQSQAMLNAAQQISPAYNDLLLSLYQKSAPELAKTGVDVEKINRTGAAQTDLDILQGTGGALVREGQKLDRELNPEFYKTRENQANKLAELMGSINLNDANPEAERLVNQENVRSGNIGNSNATSTVANALSFGSELDKRRNSLSNALNTATSFLQPSQGQFNPVVTALNRPSTNTGENRFQGIQNPSDQAYQSGNNMLNNVNQLKLQQNDINANRRDGLDRFNETLTGIGSIVSI